MIGNIHIGESNIEQCNELLKRLVD
jgi:hypothetical protein